MSTHAYALTPLMWAAASDDITRALALASRIPAFCMFLCWLQEIGGSPSDGGLFHSDDKRTM